MEPCTGLVWLRIGAGGGSCECSNEPTGSIICGELFDYLRTCWLLKKDSAPWS